VASRVAVVRCDRYDEKEVKVQVERLLSLLGENDLPPNVLIKPNMLSARAPSAAVTTHPSVLSALISMLPKPCFLGDCPPSTKRPVEGYWNECGFSQLSQETGAQLLKLEGKSKIMEVKLGRRKADFPVTALAFEHPVINVAKLKTHGLTVLTCAIKNLYGLIPGYSKSILHALFPDPESFSKLLVALYRVLQDRVILHIVDAVEGMEGPGPSHGIVRHLGFLVAGRDAVAVDMVCARLTGFKVNDIPFLRIYGKKFGFPDIELVGDDIAPVSDFKRPAGMILFKIAQWHLLSPLLRAISRCFAIVPEVDTAKCIRCMRCVQVCPKEAISGKTMKIDKKKCINCLCCYEVCPIDSIQLKKSRIVRFFM